MDVNIPSVVVEVEVAFRRYELALNENDLAALDDSFWQSALTIRYGVGENLHGIEEIRAFRAARPTAGLRRSIERSVITTFGSDCATACTLFHRDAMIGKIGRQMQTWVRFPEGWRVVAATVSVIAI